MRKNIALTNQRSAVVYLVVSLMIVIILAMTTGMIQTGECFIAKRKIERSSLPYSPR
jgi:hypothetical protein